MFRLFFAGEDDPLLVRNGPYGLFTFPHILVVLLLFATVCLAIRRIKQKTFHTRFLWAFCAYLSLVVLDVMRMIWEVCTGPFDIKEDLPLQLCGIQMFAIPFALFSHGRIGEYMREFVRHRGLFSRAPPADSDAAGLSRIPLQKHAKHAVSRRFGFCRPDVASFEPPPGCKECTKGIRCTCGMHAVYRFCEHIFGQQLFIYFRASHSV